MNTLSLSLAQKLSLAAFVLPHLTLWAGLVILWFISPTDSCIPYIESCVGVWQLGIPDPVSFVYRAGLFSTVVVWMFWWYGMKAWLISHASRPPTWAIRHILLLAGIACCALAVSIALLRPEAEHIQWEFQNTAVIIFILATTLVQGNAIGWLKSQEGSGPLVSRLKFMHRLVMFQWFLIGVYLVFLIAGADYTLMLEWWIVLVMSVFYLCIFPMWKDFRLVMVQIDGQVTGKEN